MSPDLLGQISCLIEIPDIFSKEFKTSFTLCPNPVPKLKISTFLHFSKKLIAAK